MKEKGGFKMITKHCGENVLGLNTKKVLTEISFINKSFYHTFYHHHFHVKCHKIYDIDFF